jgi:hypothetical protein
MGVHDEGLRTDIFLSSSTDAYALVPAEEEDFRSERDYFLATCAAIWHETLTSDDSTIDNKNDKDGISMYDSKSFLFL